MKRVTIYQLQPDGSQNELAVCRLEGETVVCHGDRDFINQLTTDGITDYSATNLEKIYPSDGAKFLEQLHLFFRSGYLMATAPEEAGTS